jgi:two-component system repressor protein LuxO
MNSTTMSVLLVEDDEVVRASMCFALESAQIRVIEAGTVAEGLSRFHEVAPDVVVIDLHLPDGTGFDLAKWLWRHLPHLPLVMISTDLGAAPTLQLPPEHGRITLLAKPFSASDLCDAISLVTADPARS